ncbi:MAG: hypothetical protein NC930_08210, partial [Candidatus Omnitrophica bacterium]|nr:hypothetical protein [Candidatus Omnitrophota bacterium]
QTKKLPDPKNVFSIISPRQSLQEFFKSFISHVPQCEYIAILAYTERSQTTEGILRRVQRKLRDHFHVPVLVGFGPRYLHSIGQLYKGGPAKGLFLTLLPEESEDIRVPQTGYTFGQLKRAQALGDLSALSARHRPTFSLSLNTRPIPALMQFEKKIDLCLKGCP